MEPKVLLCDIETSPSLGWYFDLWKEGNIVGTKAEWYMLSFAAKWLDGKVFAHSLPEYPGYKKNPENDKLLVKDLWKLFDEADVIIAHNGDEFDVKKSNARFIYHGLPPPAPYKTVDTLKAARKYFKFTSNRLDDLGKHLNLGRKVVHTGFHLWQSCMRGDKKAWKVMVKYNKNDVILLEKIYLKLLPWIQNHPNVALLLDKYGCPNCGSTKIQKRGMGTTRSGVFQRYQCQNCGAWSRGKGQKITDIT